MTEASARDPDIELHLPAKPASRWHRAGLERRSERILDAVMAMLLMLLTIGWSWAIVMQRSANAAEVRPHPVTSATKMIAAALTNTDAPSTAFLIDAAVNAFGGARGRSGALRVAVQPAGEPIRADSLPDDAHVVVTENGNDTTTVPRRAGIWRVAIALGQMMKPVSDFSFISLRPFADKERGRIGSYVIGSWPAESGRRVPSGRYANPQGFIEVTPENQHTQVSEHFRLRDFLTKGQVNVWPKYLVLELRLVDKLELVVDDLQKRGVTVTRVTVMSGFRTPSYNVGGGNTGGRASLSRHMYGDAADVFVDNDGNGMMDDLNRDGRVDTGDARVIAEAAERVERAHPELIGGVGVYSTCCGHGPFVHIDTRGYRARWTGTSGG
ncbi:MAG: YcbK family protein [Gemmatimonadaceae bacterium]